MSVNSNQNVSNPGNAGQSNPQLMQQRLSVREQEINALKVQNRHLLAKIDELEKAAEPNQIDTQYIADEVKRHIDPVVQQLQATLNASFEMIQSTLKGIYQQSQRSQNAVEEMAAHAQGLEIRMNEQRKQDQNFYQDKVFSMIGNFCDRLERQIDVRLKSLSVVEMVHSRQNEILIDLETLKAAIFSVQKFNEANRIDIHRIEKSTNVIHQTLLDNRHNGKGIEEAKSRGISPEVRVAAPRVTLQLRNPGNVESLQVQEPVQLGSIIQPNLEAESANPLEENAGTRVAGISGELGNVKLSSLAKEDASVILSLLRAEKNELKKVARKAREYLESTSRSETDAPDAGNPDQPAP
jgi:hypothetical protein